jgi:hypothetical protein
MKTFEEFKVGDRVIYNDVQHVVAGEPDENQVNIRKRTNPDQTDVQPQYEPKGFAVAKAKVKDHVKNDEGEYKVAQFSYTLETKPFTSQKEVQKGDVIIANNIHYLVMNIDQLTLHVQKITSEVKDGIELQLEKNPVELKLTTDKKYDSNVATIQPMLSPDKKQFVYKYVINKFATRPADETTETEEKKSELNKSKDKLVDDLANFSNRILQTLDTEILKNQ